MKRFYRVKRRKTAVRRPCKNSYNTAPERQVKAILERLDIKYQQQFPLRRKFYDFYLPDYNVLLEVDGVYWHGKNLTFEEKSPVQKRSHRNDEYKDALAKIYGFTLLRIWEGECTIRNIKRLLKIE